MTKKRVLLSAGGTGGHLYPAQTLARAIQSEVELLFVGGKLKESPYFDANHFPFEEITTSTFSMKKLIPSCFRILRGVNESMRILNRFRPHLIVGFGSFTTFPLLLAAKLKGYPLLLHEQNSIPGKVNRLFAPYSLTTAITFPDSKAQLKGPTTLVDFPVRVKKDEGLKKRAYDYFQLDEKRKILLVFGGSQGACAINELMVSIAPNLPKEIQILHFTGKDRKEKQIQKCYEKVGLRAVVKPFESQMELAYAIADLAICRAGAATICELIEWELPALLIPFPAASENHQKFNAKHFVDVAKGGELFIESELQKEKIQDALSFHLGKEGERKKNNLQNYKKKKERHPFSDVVLEHI